MEQLRALREAKVTRVTAKPAPRPTPVTAVTGIGKYKGTILRSALVVTHCAHCGQRLPAQTKTAAKQKAYRERKRAAR